MKSILYFILISFICLQSCKKDDLCNCMESTGSRITTARITETFNSIELNNNIDVILTPDTVHYVEISCGKNLQDGIKTDVVNGRLKIRNVNKCNWLRDFKNEFILNIHYVSIQQITNNGSGNLSCADTLRENYLKVDSWNGTGSLAFLFNGGEIYLKVHTGPADMIAGGKADLLYIYAAGNGYMKTADLEARNVYVTTNSTGDCEVFPQQELEATINYNGDVYYKGTPVVISKIITGKGRLIPF